MSYQRHRGGLSGETQDGGKEVSRNREIMMSNSKKDEVAIEAEITFVPQQSSSVVKVPEQLGSLWRGRSQSRGGRRTRNQECKGFITCLRGPDTLQIH